MLSRMLQQIHAILPHVQHWLVCQAQLASFVMTSSNLHVSLKNTKRQLFCVLQQTARMLHERGWLPEVVMSSNSERTRQTLEAMKEAVDAFR